MSGLQDLHERLSTKPEYSAAYQLADRPSIECLHLQVNHARCERSEFDTLIVCHVDQSWEDRRCPGGSQVGCVAIDGNGLQQWRNGGGGQERETTIRFADRAGWRRAWRIARLLRHSHICRPAHVSRAEIEGLAISIGLPHALRVDGTTYCAAV